VARFVPENVYADLRGLRRGERDVQRELIISALEELGIPRDIADQVPGLPSRVVGLLVYGSRARGDAVGVAAARIVAPSSCA
jgi:hypothetical protein